MGEYPSHYLSYIDKLSQDHGWRFVRSTPESADLNQVAYHDEQTPYLLSGWRANGKPVEVSIVIPPPNSSVLKMPVRTLGYAASALALSRQAVNEWGLKVSDLRVISPCYLREYCNGGNVYAMLENAKKLRSLIEGYKEAYYPDLKTVGITLDMGKTITEESITALKPKINRIQLEQPELTADLAQVASKYSRKSVSGRAIDIAQLPLVYLLAHPEAWGYSRDQLLYEENCQRRINYMPGSELKYLLYMSRVESIWTQAQNHEVATLLAAEYLAPPYISGKQREPKIEDLRTNTPQSLKEMYRLGWYTN